MTPELLMIIISAGVSFLMKIIEIGQQAYGKAAIPDLDIIVQKNKVTQDKIDAEKAKV